jgi:hypothetical protein
VKPAVLKAAKKVVRCGVSGKRRYRTAAAAQLALDEIRAQRVANPSVRRSERRTHACVFCGGWHLTSQA